MPWLLGIVQSPQFKGGGGTLEEGLCCTATSSSSKSSSKLSFNQSVLDLLIKMTVLMSLDEGNAQTSSALLHVGFL